MDPWILATNDILAPYTPTFVGNGYLGITGDWLGIGPGDCHLADLFNRSSDPTDTVRARLPSFNALDLHNGQHWLSGLDRNTTLVRRYEQSLNLRAATLTTRFRWHDGDRDIDLKTIVFACRHDPHLAVQRLTFTPYFDGALRLSAFVDERRGDLLSEQVALAHAEEREDGCWWKLGYSTGRDRTVAIATALTLEGAPSDFTWLPGAGGCEVSLEVKAGQSYTLIRYVAVDATQANGSSETFAAATLAHAQDARTAGYDALLAAHTAAWEELWQGEIAIEGDEDAQHAQQVVRASQYAVLSSMRANSGWSISPQGLSSRGYGGHVFWDADTWIYPGLLLTHPELAQGCVAYRCDRLDGARAKAQQYGYAGAMFPWEGDDLGVETTPDWAPCGRYEQHVTSCVALAVWQWWQTSGDEAWLRTHGWPVLRACAEFWASRVSPQPDIHDPTLTYHILDVQAADEYALHVDDNAWTNASAARCLHIAARAAELVGDESPPVATWMHIAERLHIPFDHERQIVLEYAGYTDELIKQADVVLLHFPLEWPTAPEVAANNIHYYAGRVDEAHGPAMTYAIHAILAAAAGEQDALSDYLRRSYANNLRPPFLSFAETPDNDYCTFVTGAGGLLQALIFGCGGARLTDDGLVFPHAPLLPAGWTKLRVQLRCRSERYAVEVTAQGREVHRVG